MIGILLLWSINIAEKFDYQGSFNLEVHTDQNLNLFKDTDADPIFFNPGSGSFATDPDNYLLYNDTLPEEF